jgi:hypothetical protein
LHVRQFSTSCQAIKGRNAATAAEPCRLPLHLLTD